MYLIKCLQHWYQCLDTCFISWWRHQMETFSALLAICAGSSPVPVNSKAQWRGALICFSLICVWINGWVNNRKAGDLRRYSAHYDVIVMYLSDVFSCFHHYICAWGRTLPSFGCFALKTDCWETDMFATCLRFNSRRITFIEMIYICIYIYIHQVTPLLGAECKCGWFGDDNFEDLNKSWRRL